MELLLLSASLLLSDKHQDLPHALPRPVSLMRRTVSSWRSIDETSPSTLVDAAANASAAGPQRPVGIELALRCDFVISDVDARCSEALCRDKNKLIFGVVDKLAFVRHRDTALDHHGTQKVGPQVQFGPELFGSSFSCASRSDIRARCHASSPASSGPETRR